MDATLSFIDYAKQHFDVDLPPDKVWPRLDRIVLRAKTPERFVRRFCDTYANHLQENPHLEVVARPLFFAIAMEGARQPVRKSMWTAAIVRTLRLWTRNGTRDMSLTEASSLAGILSKRLDRGTLEDNRVAEMCCASPALWQKMKAVFIAHPQANDTTLDNHMLRHRYGPHDVVLKASQKEMYYMTLVGHSAEIKQLLVEMERILLPLHHHSFAWSLAVEHCERPAPGKWMELAPAFSSLSIEPGDVFSWKIMTTLHDEKTRDASCAELVATLNRVHPNMEAAYANFWPAVSTMFEKNAQYDVAVELWTNKSLNPDILDLPTFSAN